MENWTKDKLKSKLSELGILTDNCYPKSTFFDNDEVCVSLYEREMNEDFYFFGKYDRKIYVLRKPAENNYRQDKEYNKYIVPLRDCEMIWVDKPFVEKIDASFNSMTLRQYACIKLKHPDSGLEWLDNLIRESNSNTL